MEVPKLMDEMAQPCISPRIIKKGQLNYLLVLPGFQIKDWAQMQQNHEQELSLYMV